MESAREELLDRQSGESNTAMRRMHQTATSMRFVSKMKLHHLARRRMSDAQRLGGAAKPALTLLGSFAHMITFSRINLLLLVLPIALLAKPLGMSSAAVFLLNFVSIIPLAQLLGVATEEVAIYSNEVIGGLLNATLGNATEVIISIFAIRANLLRVVQVSLLGSILSNLLLVLGCSFWVGGVVFRVQHYSQKMASVNCTLLKMAGLGLTIPTAYAATVRATCAVPCVAEQIGAVSHWIALVLFAVYCGLLLFQLRTHAYLSDHGNANERYPVHVEAAHEAEAECLVEEEAEAAAMTLSGAILSLAVLTILIALCSELLVDTLEVAAAALHLSDLFISLILLPIIGNAAEHATAVVMAYKGKTDLALGVALGSSVQISLCAIPGLVLVAWAIGSPLSLDFGVFEAIILLVSTFVATSTLNDNATWLDGVTLVGTYVIVAIVYFYKEEGSQELAEQVACVCGEACCLPSS